MSVIKSRYLICSSIGQIINTKAAFLYLDKKNNNSKFIFNDYIIIVNPNITSDLIDDINKISKKIDFKKVIDLRQDYIKINEINKKLKFSLKFKKNQIEINNLIQKFEVFGKTIENKILKYGRPYSVFVRNNYNIIDSHLLNNLDYSQLYKIEDGIGDYHSWFSKFTKLHEILHHIKSMIKKFAKFTFIIIFSRKFKFTYELIFKKKFSYIQKFLNIEKNNYTCIKNEYLNTVKKFQIKENKEINVIIIGTLLNLKNKISLKKEVELYNKLIHEIKNKYKIKSNNIWYKPHPRIDKKQLSFKNKFLNCEILHTAEGQIIETYFMSKNLIALYSIGSTSLLFSKLFFNKNAYCVIFHNIKLHPSVYKLEHLIYKKYKVKIIKI